MQRSAAKLAVLVLFPPQRPGPGVSMAEAWGWADRDLPWRVPRQQPLFPQQQDGQ